MASPRISLAAKLRALSPLGASLGLSLALALVGADAQAATCIGSCGVLGPDGDVTAPPNGATYGWVSTFGGVDGAGQLAGIGGTNGSTFTTSAFTANGGEALKYNFNFVSSDGQAGSGEFIYEDYGFVELIDANTNALVAMLFNARTEPGILAVPGNGLPPVDPGVTLSPATAMVQIGTGDGGGPLWSPLGDSSGTCWGLGCGFTGWIGSNYTIANDGDYRLVFGVSNWGDTAFDTGLAYSGIMIGEREIEDGFGGVPEPASWALMIVGFGGVGAVLRRKSLLLQRQVIGR